jgi:thioredoxin 1
MASENLHIISDDNFDEEVLQADLPVLVDFWADWCPPCKILGPIIEEIANETAGEYKICKLNVEENPKSAQKYNISGIPTVIIFKNGEVQDSVTGAVPKDVLIDSLKKVK